MSFDVCSGGISGHWKYSGKMVLWTLMKPYSDKPTLANIYLEDSWVLGIETNKTDVIFDCEFVLLKSHERY